MAASSATSAWAVGSYSDGAVRHTLVVHWNGRSWKRVRSPGPACASPGDQLVSEAVVSARDIWAVGEVTDCVFVGAAVTLIEHWNGKSWKTVPSPHPGFLGGTHLNG